jgi:hypothetical protein
MFSPLIFRTVFLERATELEAYTEEVSQRAFIVKIFLNNLMGVIALQDSVLIKAGCRNHAARSIWDVSHSQPRNQHRRGTVPARPNATA